MVRCEECDRIFDSDDDPDCFVEIGNMKRQHATAIYCETCRDEMADAIDAASYDIAAGDR